MGPKLLHVCQIRIIEQCTKSASNENAFILLSTFRKKSLKEWKNEKKNALLVFTIIDIRMPKRIRGWRTQAC